MPYVLSVWKPYTVTCRQRCSAISSARKPMVGREGSTDAPYSLNSRSSMYCLPPGCFRCSTTCRYRYCLVGIGMSSVSLPSVQPALMGDTKRSDVRAPTCLSKPCVGARLKRMTRSDASMRSPCWYMRMMPEEPTTAHVLKKARRKPSTLGCASHTSRETGTRRKGFPGGGSSSGSVRKRTPRSLRSVSRDSTYDPLKSSEAPPLPRRRAVWQAGPS
mmetsp:Transcript_23170/g.58197  ORF Transcript_23170/g.58197 Transcript_23170/m.58197 type:complete len:217 (-) Transcript_23170:246-896(-)